MAHPMPPDERERLEALASREILDTAAEQVFDDLTRMASAICGTPISLLTLVDADRQWFKSKVGLDLDETPREWAFCSYAILEPTTMIVEDAALDARFTDNPLVRGDPYIRFYAGTPLVAATGHRLGTLCVIDREPRQLSAEQISALEVLARHGGDLIDMRSREQQFRRVLELAPDGILVIDQTGTIRFANPQLASLVGLADPRDVLGQALPDLVVAEDRASFASTVRRVLETGEPRVRVETALRSATDGALPVEATLGAMTASGRPMLTVVVRDIRARREAYRRIRESQALLQAVIDNAPSAVFVKGLDGRYMVANRQVEQMLGVDEGGVRLKTDHDLLPAEAAVATRADDARVLAEGPRSYEETIPGGDDDRVLFTTKFPLLDDDGRAFAIGGISTDITERRRAENESKRLTERLQEVQRLESLGQLAGGIAHDFNNLLQIIMASVSFATEGVDMLSGDEETLAQLREDLADVNAAGDRAARLTNQLLVFSRRQPVAPEVLDLNGVVDETAQMLDRTIGDQVILELQLAANLWPVEIDPSHLDQILLNLSVNARDAMPDGGRLRIATDNTVVDEAHAEHVQALKPGPYAVLTISDTGTGMPPDVAQRAFEPFFTTKPSGRGTGLGLATVYGVVTQAGGAVGLYSEDGVGTVFRIYLPAAEGRGRGSSEPRPQALRGGGETVLVVDDEEGVRKIARRILERNGFGVVVAASGEEALRIAGARDPAIALALTDAVMPGMSGGELAAALANREAPIPTIFMSGYPQAVVERFELTNARAAAILPKPFSEEQLLRAVAAGLIGYG